MSLSLPIYKMGLKFSLIKVLKAFFLSGKAYNCGIWDIQALSVCARMKEHLSLPLYGPHFPNSHWLFAWSIFFLLWNVGSLPESVWKKEQLKLLTTKEWTKWDLFLFSQAGVGKKMFDLYAFKVTVWDIKYILKTALSVSISLRLRKRRENREEKKYIWDIKETDTDTLQNRYCRARMVGEGRLICKRKNLNFN